MTECPKWTLMRPFLAQKNILLILSATGTWYNHPIHDARARALHAQTDQLICPFRDERSRLFRELELISRPTDGLLRLRDLAQFMLSYPCFPEGYWKNSVFSARTSSFPMVMPGRIRLATLIVPFG
jgi:hypothetical protein